MARINIDECKTPVRQGDSCADYIKWSLEQEQALRACNIDIKTVQGG